MRCEFVGGSQDGAIWYIPEQTNTRLSVPIPYSVCGIAQDAHDKGLRCEEYEFRDDRRYHFIGYI